MYQALLVIASCLLIFVFILVVDLIAFIVICWSISFRNTNFNTLLPTLNDIHYPHEAHI